MWHNNLASLSRLLVVCLVGTSTLLPASPAQGTSSGYIGVIYSYRTCDVSSEVPGVLLRYRVRLGDSVAQGQTLACLDKAANERNLAMAEATLGAARAEEIKATVELEQARQVLERRDKVAWALSKEELERLGAQESLAIATLDVARSRTSEQAAGVQKARDDLKKCDIRAPFAGRVGSLYQSEGTLVHVGAPIARLVASSELRVRFAVPPEDADHVHAGTWVDILPEDGGPQLGGRIENVAPEVDAAAGMVFVEARLETPKVGRVSVRPGTVVRVRSGGRD
jgi:membrane fusion protein (multidrug efflux system)